MVPKVPRKGRSFRGAGLYYLHDKNALTADRVAFTQTENLPTNDPDMAIKCMAYTAMRQDDIKRRAGGSAKGRKLTQPVYVYSLSWHPEEAPDQEEMIGAARESLQALGLHEGYETLMVSHKDEPHPHIHIIVNRVHPETGVAAGLNNDFLKLSQWAEEYEKRRGKVYCEDRVKNNERRRQGEFAKDKAQEAEFFDWRRKRTEEALERRERESKNLAERQVAQRKALYQLKEQQIAHRLRQIREDHKRNWSALFHGQKMERAQQREARLSANERLRYFLSNKEIDKLGDDRKARRGYVSRAFNVIDKDRQSAADLARAQAERRAQLADKIQELKQQAIREVNETYKKQLEQLGQRHAQERHEQARDHSRQSQDAARDIKQGTDRGQFDQERQERQYRAFRELGDEMTQDRGRERSRERRWKPKDPGEGDGAPAEPPRGPKPKSPATEK